MRIARFLAAAGIGSRRTCERYVRDGRVLVDGRRVDGPALNVEPGVNEVRFDGRPVKPNAPRYIVLNKPPGYTCSARDAHAAQLVFELLPPRLGRLFTVGRLDRESEGLLLLTNDGDVAERVAHPRHGVMKTYWVWCSGFRGPPVLRELRRGIVDAGEHLRPEAVRVRRREGDRVRLEFVLREGRKREIRRLCDAVGLKVERLLRRRIGDLSVAGLGPGQWRELDAAEIEGLLRLCSAAPSRGGRDGADVDVSQRGSGGAGS